MTIMTDRFLITTLTLIGFLLIFGGAALADPVGDNCSTQCQLQQTVITSPKLSCGNYDDPTCFFCNPGATNSRCVQYVGPSQPFCVKTGTTNLRAFTNGGCGLSCTLNFNGTSQATFGNPPLGPPVGVDLYGCSTVAPTE